MPLSTSFANQVTDLPSQLDTDFAQIGAMQITTCTATGSNAISLTPLNNQPPVTAYQNYQQFSFVAAADATSAVSVQAGSLGFQPLYLHDGTTQGGSGDIKGNILYTIGYNTALNGGLGGFQLLSQMPVSGLLDIAGSKNQGALFIRGASSWGSLAPGGSGNLLQSLGSTLAWSGTKKFQQLVFQSPGPFNFSSSSGLTSTTVVKIILVGGGGGGGGGINNTFVSGPGGGGSGAIALGFISGLSANTIYSGLVGGGGSGGEGTGGGAGIAGSGGGMTSISFGGVQFTAAGGGPGGGGNTKSTNGGSGGVATNTAILIGGSIGGAGGLLSNTPIPGSGGRGWFGGIIPGIFNTAAVTLGAFGAGGGGGASITSGINKGLTGVSGNSGLFIMEWMQ